MKVKTTRVTLLMRLDDSEVLNEIASGELDLMSEPITDDTRQPGDAPEAVTRVRADIPKLLRDFADTLEHDNKGEGR